MKEELVARLESQLESILQENITLKEDVEAIEKDKQKLEGLVEISEKKLDEDAQKFNVPMQLEMKDLEFGKTADGKNWGFKILSTYEEQIKQSVLGLLTTETSWRGARNKIHASV